MVDKFDYNLWDADKKQVRGRGRGRRSVRVLEQQEPYPCSCREVSSLTFRFLLRPSVPLPQVCICDAGYSGIDCSERMCPRGADPLLNDEKWCGHTGCAWEVQSFTLQKTGTTTYKVSLTDALNVTHVALATVDTAGNTFNGYVDPSSPTFASVLPDPATTIAGQIMAALRATPGGLLQQVEVWPAAAVGTSPQDLTFRVTFVNVPGNQEQLAVEVYAGNGGLTCNPDHSAYAADTASGSCAAAGSSKAVVRKVVGNRPENECAGRGNCDTKTGVCKCFTGFYGAVCEVQNALAMVSAGWMTDEWMRPVTMSRPALARARTHRSICIYPYRVTLASPLPPAPPCSDHSDDGDEDPSARASDI